MSLNNTLTGIGIAVVATAAIVVGLFVDAPSQYTSDSADRGQSAEAQR